MNKLLTVATFFFFIITSCSSENNNDVTNLPNNNVTYKNTIKAIIDANCLNCHSNPPTNGAPMSLTTYQNVKEAVENRDLIGRVENGTMPPSGNNLTTAQVQAIKDWETNGFVD